MISTTFSKQLLLNFTRSESARPNLDESQFFKAYCTLRFNSTKVNPSRVLLDNQCAYILALQAVERRLIAVWRLQAAAPSFAWRAKQHFRDWLGLRKRPLEWVIWLKMMNMNDTDWFGLRRLIQTQEAGTALRCLKDSCKRRGNTTRGIIILLASP